MLYIHNIKQYVKSLGEYIENRDYSHPYIVAGWSGIGKSAIAYKEKNSFLLCKKLILISLVRIQML